MAPSSSPPVIRFAYLSDTAGASALAFVGGAVDALGWYGLFNIFTGSITGNIVIGGASYLPGITGYAPRLWATLAFVLANVMGHFFAFAFFKVWGIPLRRVLLFLLFLEACALICAWVAGVMLARAGRLDNVDEPAVALVASLYAIAMGLQNCAVLEACDGYPATTVVTTTLSKVGISFGEGLALSAAAAGWGPLPAAIARLDLDADRRLDAARSAAAVARTALFRLLAPVATFSAGVVAGVGLQHRIGFHSTSLPLLVIICLIVSAALPHPSEARPATALALTEVSAEQPQSPLQRR